MHCPLPQESTHRERARAGPWSRSLWQVEPRERGAVRMQAARAPQIPWCPGRARFLYLTGQAPGHRLNERLRPRGPLQARVGGSKA